MRLSHLISSNSLKNGKSFRASRLMLLAIVSFFVISCGTNDALDRLQQKAWQNPNDAGAQYDLGSAYGSLAQYDKAAETFEKVVKLDPKNIKGYSALGAAYFNLKRYDSASKAFEKAVELSPNDIDKQYDLGNAYYKLEDYLNAVKTYEKIIRLDSTFYDAYYNLGASYLMTGNKAGAEKMYEVLKVRNNYLAGSLLQKMQEPQKGNSQR